MVESKKDGVLALLVELEKQKKPKTVKRRMYLHSDKESNWGIIADVEEDLGISISEEIKREFAYSLYEVEFTTEINIETGKVMILAVNGVELKEPTEG